MEKISILIADDESDHLEAVFDTVNIYDPILSNDVLPDDSHIVKGYFSAGDLPCKLVGHAEVQCVSTLNSAKELFEEDKSFDICITDINFSGEDADGPSIASACGASQENKLLYTSREEVENIYEKRGSWITSMEEFTRVRKEDTKVVKYFSEEREEIIYTFLTNAELRIAAKKIDSTPRSRDAESSWKKFRESLNALLVEDEPRRDKLEECEESLTTDLRNAAIAGTRFRHLFPFRYSFLVRRLMEARRILDGDADETDPSWREVKFGIDKKSDQIDDLILGTENLRTTRQRNDEKETSRKLIPKKITLDLINDNDADVLVETKNGINFELGDITNSGIFLLLAVKLRNDDENQIDGPVRRIYDKWSPPIMASSLLLNELRSPSRGSYSKFLLKKVRKDDFYEREDEYKATPIKHISSEDIFRSIHDEENSWEEDEHNMFVRRQIGKYEESKHIIKPVNGNNHMSNITYGTPENMKPILHVNSGIYMFPEYVESFFVRPEWIKSKKGIKENAFL